MRLVLDQGVPRDAAALLRSVGYDSVHLRKIRLVTRSLFGRIEIAPAVMAGEAHFRRGGLTKPQRRCHGDWFPTWHETAVITAGVLD